MLQSGPFKSLLLCGVYVPEECVDVLYFVPVVSSCLFNAEITGMFGVVHYLSSHSVPNVNYVLCLYHLYL